MSLFFGTGGLLVALSLSLRKKETRAQLLPKTRSSNSKCPNLFSVFLLGFQIGIFRVSLFELRPQTVFFLKKRKRVNAFSSETTILTKAPPETNTTFGGLRCLL